MKISSLSPYPSKSDSFRMSRARFYPANSGCYVLTTFEGVVLYIGLTNNLRRRICEHLENPKKTELTPLGRAVLVHWFETDDVNTVERTWQNIHLISEGALPMLNSLYSPTST